MKAEDFDLRLKCSEGGCLADCLYLRTCGHVCKSTWNAMDQAHKNKYAKCYEPCRMQCDAGMHACKAKCYQQCPPCIVKVEKVLRCRHKKEVFCHIDISTIICYIQVLKKLPCGHETELACHLDPTSYTCQVKVEKTLRCHHKRIMECHKDPDLHTCRIQVDKCLPCGHTSKDECRIQPDQIKCEVDVEIEVKTASIRLAFLEI